MLLSCILIKTPSLFYSSLCSSLLYVLTPVSPPFIPLDTALDYSLLSFLTLPLAAFLSGYLHLAALDILHFNSNTGFLSPCITDMPQRPWQLPLGSSCHRPTWGCAAETSGIFGHEFWGALEFVFNILFLKALSQHDWKSPFIFWSEHALLFCSQMSDVFPWPSNQTTNTWTWIPSQCRGFVAM